MGRPREYDCPSCFEYPLPKDSEVCPVCSYDLSNDTNWSKRIPLTEYSNGDLK